MGPSQKEIENAAKVLGFLCDIEDISYSKLREDIFEVQGLEGTSCVVDVEESLVCISATICEIPEDESIQYVTFKALLELNHTAIHGKFTSDGAKIYFKENLEFENLDKNELEAALAWVLIMVKQGAEKLSTIIV
jgi:hypothetical protein